MKQLRRLCQGLWVLTELLACLDKGELGFIRDWHGYSTLH